MSESFEYSLPTVVSTHTVVIPNYKVVEGPFSIQFESPEIVALYNIVNVKSNGFIIPGSYQDGTWTSSVTLAAGDLENIEVTIQHI